MIFDPLMLLILAPAMLLAMWAQFKVKSAYQRASEIPNSRGASGAQAARAILDANGLQNVGVEPHEGWLSDHYDPRHKVLRLSPGVYQDRSLAAVGIAAHEAGHAIQDATDYGPLVIRNGLVPLASTGSWLSVVLIMLGFMLAAGETLLGTSVLYAGIGLFAVTVLFQLVNLPVEFDASSRAKTVLVDMGIIRTDELPMVRKVLSAAALTYVAATLIALLQLLYFLWRAGLLGGRRD